jgi:hypothetical protein
VTEEQAAVMIALLKEIVEWLKRIDVNIAAMEKGR